ncbi:MAG: restriction endonuclease subunit S [Deltaproteobacteria bacterium]|nr:restriction endonuclease subunit S [Deltaproteobacteria bacterium]
MVEAMEIPKGFKKTELGIIPSDWEVKTLGGVGEVKMCRRVFNHETQFEGTIPFYKIGTFGKEADAYISEDLYNNYRQRFSFPKKGDILISAAGTIGRTLIYDGTPAYFQDSNIVWIDNKESLISNNFLYHVFQVVKYNTEGGTIQRLYNNILRSTKFLCPPTKAEQTAIATALNDADSLITQLEKLIAKKRAIKQGAMQALLTGKRRLSGFEQKRFKETDLGLIPSDWNLHILGEVSYMKGRIGWQGLKQTEFTMNPDEPFLITGMNFKDGEIRWDEVYHVPEDRYQVAKEIQLKQGDVLITKDGTIGKLLYVEQIPYPHKATLNSHLLVFRPIAKSYDPLYLYYNLSSSYFKNHIELNKSGTTFFGISQETVSKYLIPLPSTIAEQSAIGNVLSNMDAEIETLEKKLDKYKMLKQGMMQNLLTGKTRLMG